MDFYTNIYIFSFYTNIFYLLFFCLRAWTVFIAKHREAFQPKIIWVYDFPVHIQIYNFRLGIFKMYNYNFIFYSPLQFSVRDKSKEIIYAGTTFVNSYTITVATRMMIV
jgi:hypothetical protein